MVSLRIPRVGAPRAFLRYPSFHLALATLDLIEVSVELATTALLASLFSKPAHMISGNQPKKSLASVNRTLSASSSPSSVSTQLIEGHFLP